MFPMQSSEPCPLLPYDYSRHHCVYHFHEGDLPYTIWHVNASFLGEVILTLPVGLQMSLIISFLRQASIGMRQYPRIGQLLVVLV